jgi:hypothetical protein
MHECPHCGESFDAEEAYLRHLGERHADALGPIERRRVEALDTDDGGPSTASLALGVVGLLVVGVGLALFAFDGGGVSPDGVEAESLPDRGDDALLTGVERVPSQGTDHVPRETDLDYDRVPPLSGPHYAGTVDAGFYEETQPLGDVVHTLEHGAVVVYYDPGALTPAAERSLREWAVAHDGHWSSVVVVPNPDADPESAYVLTAWRTELRLDSYDPDVVRAFLAEYLGRGPENPVR